MILDDITLHNFGLYAGSQTISLTPPSPDKPIILIGGLNGGGKTTFLDALQLCLFGPHARISNRGTLAYSEYLSRSIHRGAANGASIEINFRHTVEGREERYRLHRSWRRNGGGCKEHFEVLKNGAPEPALSDNWASQVEEFFPANIAHLFLFDGEQVEAYASQQDSSALIGAAIQNLLGLDMVDQLEKDLQVYERRKRTENKDDALHAEIAAAQDTLRDLRRRVEALKQERAALRTHRIGRTQRAFHEVEDNYRKLGGTLYDQREDVERRWAEAQQALKDGEATLRDLAAGPLPLLLVRVLLESTESRDRHEEECRRARDLFEVLKARDRAALKHMRTKSADQTAIDVLKEFFDADRTARQALGKKETVLDIAPEVRSDLHALLRGDLDEIAADTARLLKRQKKLEAAAAQARIEYENVPSADTIARVATARETLKQELAELDTTYAAMGQDIERQERELERKEQALARLIEADANEKGARDDRSRILRHSEKVRVTLGAFRRAVIDRHVRRIEQLVLESYQQLLRKGALVTRLSIDPESYALTLFGRDGDVLSAERLSAGERQLLAIALLWGLAKASGRPLPTAIDTPLGRLDSVHRMHLVERYLPYASHQVLLLSTDEEIAGEYLARLTPWIGRTYWLSYDDEAGETCVRSGYLEAREAA
ncbi:MULTISPECIES: DNA sulfur modification protein DndD [Rhodomicrobium]|uniref:DNA sulfur modification protein DndD n=1 Tax=Rhodomicrobium TaxID=1068 RepID=UPI000B4AFF06|nr:MULTISPECIES: DNA sulfur modification protein DndD [Rhodomicrobium]